MEYNVKFNRGNINVNGINRYFSQTIKNCFAHIHHVIFNDNGIGCKNRVFVGSVPV